MDRRKARDRTQVYRRGLVKLLSAQFDKVSAISPLLRQNLFDTLDDFRRLVDNFFGDLGQFFTADRGNLQVTLGRIGQERRIGHG